MLLGIRYQGGKKKKGTDHLYYEPRVRLRKPTGVHETATQQCCMRLMIFICEGTAVPGKELNTKHARHEEAVSRKGKEHVDASGSQEFHFVQFTQRLIRMLRLN